MAERVNDFKALDVDELEEVSGGARILPLGFDHKNCLYSTAGADFDHVWEPTGNKQQAYEGDPQAKLEYRCIYCGKTMWE